MARELLAGAGKVPVGAIAKQKRFQSKSKSKERSDTPYNRGGLPIDNVKSVVKNIHQENAQHIGKDVTNAKAWDTLQECAEPKILARGAHILDNLGGNTMKLKEHITHVVIVTVQDLKVIMNCMRTLQIVYNTTTAPTSIKFDEISNSQALGDLSLSNKAGKVITQRFKLDSGACANLIPISVYSRLFNKSDRDLKTTIDHRVKLIAANNKQIKQLGTVNLRVKAEDREKVCKFYIVPDSCRPILGLPDLKRMDLVQFKVPTTSQWTDYVSSIEPSTPNTNPIQPKEPTNIQKGITKDQVLAKYKKVFTGLGRLKVTPVKIHLKPGVEPQQKPCRRVPIAIRGQFKDELDSMEGQGTITKLDKNTVTPWLNSFVNVGKKDQKSLRVCLDPTGLNPYIIRPVCNSYTLDEISNLLKDAKVMSVVDANKGFFSNTIG